jgi:hypothetical protein
MVIKLIRNPSEGYRRQQEPGALFLQKLRHKYEYKTPDGRWLVRETCGGWWAIVDTTGRVVCERHPCHAIDVKTLDAAKAFIAEWDDPDGPIGKAELGETGEQLELPFDDPPWQSDQLGRN